MVDYIKWKDKDYPVKLGWIAFSEYTSKSGKVIINQPFNADDHSKLLWIAIKTGHKLLNEKFYNEDGTPVITEEDCYWLLDDCLMKYLKIYNNSLAKLEGTLEETQKDKKK
jgi:hypothetical protein